MFARDRMATPDHGPIAKAFIAMNRIFGAGAAVGGAYLLAIAVLALVRGRDFSAVWPMALWGFALILAGVVYLRAPLFREARRDERADTLSEQAVRRPIVGGGGGNA